MKKIFTLTLFLLIILIATNVIADTTTIEIVEDNNCKITLNNESSLEKKIISSDLTNHQVTLQLEITNDSEAIIPTGELMLVIDSSDSMDTIVEGTTTRKDLVLDSANKLVESLLKVNSNLKIGVVTFSTGTETDSESHLITGTEADAQKVCDLTTDLSKLTTSISTIEGTGQYTNLDSGLQLAKKSFSSEDNNKYMIVLTDGLPNLAVGHNDLVSYDGLTNVITQTKTTLKSLSDINVITMLTGIDNEEAIFRQEGDNSYTYGQVINEVFGTEENPTIGKFYNISDGEIEQTITNDIYEDLVPITQSLKNITVVDYFPQYIVDNFEMTYVEGIDTSNVSAEIDKETNSITWNLAELSAGQSAKIQYNLTLKEEFDETIIDKVLDTNEKVEINYTDFDNTKKTVDSDVTPKIKLTTPTEDNTIAKDDLPQTGSPLIVLGFVCLVSLGIFLGYKSQKIK